MAIELKSAENVEQLLKDGKIQPPVPVTAPTFHISNAAILPSPTEFSIICQRFRPAFINIENQQMPIGINESVAVLQMSPGAAKDLSILLVNTLVQFEKEWGTIQTEYTRLVAAQKA